MRPEFQVLKFLFIREIREKYIRPWVFITDFIDVFLMLCLYWYTAKAFIPSAASELKGSGYFDFILIGDLTFLLPAVLMSGVANSVRRSMSDGTWEILLTMPSGPHKIVGLISIATLPSELIRAALMLLVANLMFGYQIPQEALPGFVLLQLSAIPLFYGCGLIGAALFLFFGRGETVLSYLSTLGIMMAGAYFPVAVLPEVAQRISKYVSPFDFLLSQTRMLFGGSATTPASLEILVTMLLMNAVFLALGLVLFSGALKSLRGRGTFLAPSAHGV